MSCYSFSMLRRDKITEVRRKINGLMSDMKSSMKDIRTLVITEGGKD